MGSIKLKHTSGNGTIIHSPAANPTNDVTLKLPSTTGSAGQVLQVASANHSATNAELEFGAVTAGITMCDTWRITTSFNHTNGDLTSNWSRQQTPATHFGGFGSAMTESSGIFTFPSNGHYLVTSVISGYNNGGARTYVGNIQRISTNSGSSYSNAISAWTSGHSDSAHWSVVTTDIYDITAYASTRWKQYLESQGLNNVFGSSSGNMGLTGVTFIRLGDT